MAQTHTKCSYINNNNISVKTCKAPRCYEANQNLVFYYTTRIGKVANHVKRTIGKDDIYKNTL